MRYIVWFPEKQQDIQDGLPFLPYKLYPINDHGDGEWIKSENGYGNDLWCLFATSREIYELDIDLY